MKVKRQKHARRILAFYKNSFGINAPYSVLIDGTFCKSALMFRINISEQLPKYLNSEAKLYTTKCILAECEALGTSQNSAVLCRTKNLYIYSVQYSFIIDVLFCFKDAHDHEITFNKVNYIQMY